MGPSKRKVIKVAAHLMSPWQKYARQIARKYKGKRMTVVKEAHVRRTLQSTMGPNKRKVIEVAAYPMRSSQKSASKYRGKRMTALQEAHVRRALGSTIGPKKRIVIEVEAHAMSPSQTSARHIARKYSGEQMPAVKEAHVGTALESTIGPKKRKAEVEAHPMSSAHISARNIARIYKGKEMTAVKEAHVWKALESNIGNKRIVTSAALAKTLSDIGVNTETIQLRRTTFLYIEDLKNILGQERGEDCDRYHFGSQSEGSTTDGMDSDIDCLECKREFLNIPNIADRQFELKLLVVTDMSLPPQCCCLQLLMPDYSILTEDLFQYLHIDAQGRIFFKNTLLKTFITYACKVVGRDYIQHGPALLICGYNVDNVFAFHCATLPEDCQYVFRRPKPGHWPTLTLLEQLKNSGVFLVSAAYVENTTHWDPRQHLGSITVRTFDNSHELYWRLSTSLMERLLMFDLSMTQIKVYVIMKIIRKEFFKPFVGDRLSTFHMKTTLLYCVEMSPPCIWKDENLIQCLKFCLTTLRRWLKVRYCPHYTTVNVNLFAGKLRWNEFPVLIELLTDMIRNDVSCLHNVKMDDLGNRLSSNSTYSTNGLPFEELNIVVARKMFGILIYAACGSFYAYRSGILTTEGTSTIINYLTRNIQKLETIYESSTGQIRSAVSCILPFRYSVLAAMGASLCIGNNQTLPQEIFTLCDKSLISDVTSSRLKLASIYFSARRFDEAAAILKQVDALITNKVINVSTFIELESNKFDSELLGRRKEFLHMLQNEVALCTIFTRHEINCVPGRLVAECYRTVTVEDASCRLPHHYWMDYAVVDSLPFMYYLQYYISLFNGRISDMDSAFKNLQYQYLQYQVIFMISNDVNLYHIETTLNMIGDCWELEGNLSEAWRSYKESVTFRPRNNAAYWHMFRMIGGLYYGLKMLSW
ncbi:hypothetical protein DPMN_162163 [Dreissena polymorpha]|uniref:Mab-21-like HhH/H2TH-like domain-containing protein n=2 Tax=Dreissena polymorpha TaxID=45954 RepID=A0A9D4ETI0_DREPO|nr:hypothetical protein DPMN_162163 [Dreissena polymorpha]